MTTILTARLLVRDVRREDAEATARLWSDPVVMQYMGGPRFYQEVFDSIVDDATKDIQRDVDTWSVIERTTGELVGNCGLVEKEVNGRTECELVYVFFAASWGRGYATEAARAVRDEAFGRLDKSTLVALIDPENAPSERVAVKIGMRYRSDTTRPSGKTLRVYAAKRASRIGW
jgi:RimJ/RimL family protein N-acetyltransferase